MTFGDNTPLPLDKMAARQNGRSTKWTSRSSRVTVERVKDVAGTLALAVLRVATSIAFVAYISVLIACEPTALRVLSFEGTVEAASPEPDSPSATLSLHGHELPVGLEGMATFFGARTQVSGPVRVIDRDRARWSVSTPSLMAALGQQGQMRVRLRRDPYILVGEWQTALTASDAAWAATTPAVPEGIAARHETPASTLPSLGLMLFALATSLATQKPSPIGRTASLGVPLAAAALWIGCVASGLLLRQLDPNRQSLMRQAFWVASVMWAYVATQPFRLATQPFRSVPKRWSLAGRALFLSAAVWSAYEISAVMGVQSPHADTRALLLGVLVVMGLGFLGQNRSKHVQADARPFGPIETLSLSALLLVFARLTPLQAPMQSTVPALATLHWVLVVPRVAAIFGAVFDRSWLRFMSGRARSLAAPSVAVPSRQTPRPHQTN